MVSWLAAAWPFGGTLAHREKRILGVPCQGTPEILFSRWKLILGVPWQGTPALFSMENHSLVPCQGTPKIIFHCETWILGVPWQGTPEIHFSQWARVPSKSFFHNAIPWPPGSLFLLLALLAPPASWFLLAASTSPFLLTYGYHANIIFLWFLFCVVDFVQILQPRVGLKPWSGSEPL